MMLACHRDILVGSRTHCQVSETTWQCWQKFLAWTWEQGEAVPQMFQGGWGIKLDEQACGALGVVTRA